MNLFIQHYIIIICTPREAKIARCSTKSEVTEYSVCIPIIIRTETREIVTNLLSDSKLCAASSNF